MVALWQDKKKKKPNGYETIDSINCLGLPPIDMLLLTMKDGENTNILQSIVIAIVEFLVKS